MNFLEKLTAFFLNIFDPKPKVTTDKVDYITDILMGRGFTALDDTTKRGETVNQRSFTAANGWGVTITDDLVVIYDAEGMTVLMTSDMNKVVAYLAKHGFHRTLPEGK